MNYTKKIYKVKNLTKNRVSKGCYTWQPKETKECLLNEIELFGINACVYLSVEKEEIKSQNIKTEDLEINITKEEKPDELRCPKCGKKYKDEKYYNIHIEKCKVGE